MKICIYQEPSGGIGGSEFVAVVMARALRDRHDVEIVHHRPEFAPADLESAFGLDLAGVRFRHVPRPAGDPLDSGRHLLAARRYWRRWNAAASEGYDLFVASLHGIPPHCRSGRGLGYVHFPINDLLGGWPWSHPPRPGLRNPIDRFRRRLYDEGWRERIGTYHAWLANSAYTAGWVRRRWGATASVIYPPVLLQAYPPEPKANAIVVLSRFTRWKQQAALIDVFTRFVSAAAPGWELVLVGGLSTAAEDRAYLEELQKAATGYCVRFVVDATPEQVRAELARAQVFWHGMGLGVDVSAAPHLAEHFGIAVVEGMAAGCVPVVPSVGGPAEIVTHGESGYVCRDAAELAAATERLVRDLTLCKEMASAARLRARQFGVEQFTNEFLSTVSSCG